MSLTIGKKLNNYRGRNGRIHFVYEVLGSKKDLESYTSFREAKGWSTDAIFNSMQPVPKGTPLGVSQDGTRYFAQTDLEVAHDKEELRREIARQVAAAYIGQAAYASAAVATDDEEVEEAAAPKAGKGKGGK